MSDSKLVLVAKELVDAIKTDREAGSFSNNDFSVDWEIGGRVQLRQSQGSNLPEEWLLQDSRLQVRVMVPRNYAPAGRKDRNSQGYVAAWDIDIRQRLGASDQDEDQSVRRELLSELMLFEEELFEATGPNLTAARVSITDASDTAWDAEWIGQRDDITMRSQILVACSPLHLQHRQFYGAIRQVFELTS